MVGTSEETASSCPSGLTNQLSKKSFDHLPDPEYISMMQQVEEGHVWSHCIPDKEARPGRKLNRENHHVLQVARSLN